MEKNNKGIILALSIVIVCLVGAVIYLATNGNFTKNNPSTGNNNSVEKDNPTGTEDKKDDNKESVNENLSLEDATVKKLYGYTKVNLSTKEYFATNESLTNKTVSNTMKLGIAFETNGISQYSRESDTTWVASSTIVLDQINKIFGSDNGYSHITESFIMMHSAPILDSFSYCSQLEYDSTRSVYKASIPGGCGDETLINLQTKLKEAKKIGDTIVLTEKMYVGFGGNVYKDMKLTKVIQEQVSASTINNNQEYFDKGATVTYTFKLSNGNYYFDNSKITY